MYSIILLQQLKKNTKNGHRDERVKDLNNY